MKEERSEKIKPEEVAGQWDRRAFIGAAALACAAMTARAGSGQPETEQAPGAQLTPGPKQAPDGRLLTAGLVGCGGRGSGAAVDFLSAGPNLQITSLGDVFEDRIEECRKKLRDKKGVEVSDEKTHVGFDAFHRVIEDGPDLIILATPPHFRPEHFHAAVEAGKHVFMEKPVAVDPAGARHIMETADQADAKGLCVATGTQRRHQRSYIETFNRVMEGRIGRIVAARCYWNQAQLWYKERRQGWSDMEWMIRDWVNWLWLSGDHIVEQHVHNIDVVNWFTNSHPVRAVGFGGRARRVTGDQYDYFSVDYELEDGVHVHSMCRQVDGCADNVSEFVVGTRGASNCADTIYDLDGNEVWKYGEGGEGAEASDDNSPYVQEHVDLVTSIRTGQPFNEARNTAVSTLTAIMGRISAYTGAAVTWEEMMQSEMRLGPVNYVMGPLEIPTTVPVPGSA